MSYDYESGEEYHNQRKWGKNATIKDCREDLVQLKALRGEHSIVLKTFVLSASHFHGEAKPAHASLLVNGSQGSRAVDRRTNLTTELL